MATFNHVALAFGQTGQVVQFYPPMAEVLAYGAPTAAATYRVLQGTQSNDSPVLFSGTATLDTVSTTVNAGTGYTQGLNRQLVSLTSTTGITVGRRYLLQNAQGQREICVPYMVDVANISVEEQLAYDFTVGTSTFVGLRHSFVIDPTFIVDLSRINVYGALSPMYFQATTTSTQAPPYRVEWRYTTGTVDQRTWTTFDVARQPAKANLSITDLRGILPDVVFAEWISQRGQDFAPQLEAAQRDMQIDARAAGYDPDAIRDPQVWDRLTLQKWVVIIGKALLFNGANVSAWLEMAMTDYTRMFEKLIGTSLRAWVDTGSVGAITVDPARQLWFRGR
jgi:hypothetical protein